MDSSRQATDAQQEQVLKVQKENLAAQVKVQKIRLSELETQLQQLRQREAICQQSLLHTDDLWSQLQRNLQAAAEAAGISPAGSTSDADKPLHTFLHQLVACDAAARASVQAKLDDLHGQLSSNEQVLSSRASKAQEALAVILQRLQAVQDNHAHPATISSGSADPALERNTLSHRLQAQQGLHLATQAQLDQASSQNALLQNRVADLQNMLLDSEDSLDSLRKKMAKLTSGSPGKGPAGTGHSSSDAARLSGDVEAAVELQQLQQMLEQRTTDLEHQRSMGSKLERCSFLRHILQNWLQADMMQPASFDACLIKDQAGIISC